jgi:uncharacterized protein YjiS (DUF1127 family)
MNTQHIKIVDGGKLYYDLGDITRMAQRERSIAFAQLLKAIGNKISGLIQKFSAWKSRRAATAELMSLDDRMLADIGIGRIDIQATISGRLVRNAANTNDQDRDAA